MKNLQAGIFLEDQASNTFAVNFTWDPPPFQYGTMLHYNLFYDFSGYPRDHFPCPGVMRKGFGCLIKNVVSTILILLQLIIACGLKSRQYAFFKADVTELATKEK